MIILFQDRQLYCKHSNRPRPPLPRYSLSQLTRFLAGGYPSANGAVQYEHFEFPLPVTISAVLHLSSIGPGMPDPGSSFK